MNERRTRQALFLFTALASACATTGTAETPATNTATRNRPRRRAVTAALDEASGLATRCLPPGIGRVHVTGAFDGETGGYIVAAVSGPQAIATGTRSCVRDAFERAHVDPFREARFMSDRDIDAPPTSGAGGLGAFAPGAENPAVTPVASPVAAAGTNPPATNTATPTTTAGLTPTPTPAATSTIAVTATPTVATTPTRDVVVAGAANTPSPPVEPVVPVHPRVGRGGGLHPSGGAMVAAPSTQVGPLRSDTPLNCYRTVARVDADVGGRMRLQFNVTSDGAPAEVHAEALGATTGAPPRFAQVMRCVEQRVRRMTFARTAAGAYDLAIALMPGGDGGHVEMSQLQGGLTTNAPGSNDLALLGSASGGSGMTPGPGLAPPTAGGNNPVQPGLPQSIIAGVVRARVEPIRACYQTMLTRDPALALRVRVRFGIQPAGSVQYASSTVVVDHGNADQASEVGRCLEGVMRQLTFPPRPDAQIQEASVPFVFRPTEGAPESASSSSGGGSSSGAATPSDPHAAAVYDAVRGNVTRIRGCYNGGLAIDPTLSGRVQVRFTIGSAGTIDEISSTSVTNVGDPRVMGRVRQCVEGVMQPLRFPPPPNGTATFTLPFDFGPSN